MLAFDKIVIIYNPKSTGSSEELAKDFAKSAKKVFPQAKTKLIATKFSKHAEEIAAKIAKENGRILLVSSSGDGGYNEVINGLMAANIPLKAITAAVLPAGNANDHSRTMHEAPLTERLTKAKQTRIDLLKVTITNNGEQKARYAHSYIGLGLTPQVAIELNKHDLNPLREAVLVGKTFQKFKPFKVEYGGKVRTLDNLVFSNINQMAKFLTLADKNKPRDGRFEVIIIRHRGKLKLVYKMARAAVGTLRPQKRAKYFEFTVLQKTPMQLDGEVIKLDKNTKVVVTIAARALKTLV